MDTHWDTFLIIDGRDSVSSFGCTPYSLQQLCQHYLYIAGAKEHAYNIFRSYLQSATSHGATGTILHSPPWLIGQRSGKLILVRATLLILLRVRVTGTEALEALSSSGVRPSEFSWKSTTVSFGFDVWRLALRRGRRGYEEVMIWTCRWVWTGACCNIYQLSSGRPEMRNLNDNVCLLSVPLRMSSRIENDMQDLSCQPKKSHRED